MTGPQRPPEDWPIDREPEYLEEKLAPFEDYGEWQQKRGEEKRDRLGNSGMRLASALGSIQRFMDDYDMTPQEAIECLEYEIEEYRSDRE